MIKTSLFKEDFNLYQLANKMNAMTPNTADQQAQLYQLTITLDGRLSENEAAQFSCFFEDLGDALTLKKVGLEPKNWLLQIISQDALGAPLINKKMQIAIETCQGIFDLGKTVPSFQIEALPDTDWLAENYAQFKPIEVGDFYIFGTHDRDKALSQTQPNLIPIEINAANAFGTGDHATTKGCLVQILKLKEQGFMPDTILDLGCGSGILAIAAAKTWPEATIIATDMDEDSVIVARDYAARNQVKDHIIFDQAIGYQSTIIAQDKPYDLILANILAGPLIDLAEETADHLEKTGYVLLSGTLIEQENDVANAHKKHGLKMGEAVHIDEWTSFLMQF